MLHQNSRILEENIQSTYKIYNLYVDAVLVYSESIDQHFKYLNILFNIILKTDLILSYLNEYSFKQK